MVNPPPAAPTLVTVGLALNANVPAFVPFAFVTVIVPILVVVVAVPVLHPAVPPELLHSAGEGAENVSIAPVTVKLVVAEPPGVLTVTVAGPKVPVRAIANDVVIWVPAPLTVTAPTVIPLLDGMVIVAPARFIPVMVTGFTVVPRTPDVGEMPLIVGATVPVPPWNSTAPGSKWLSLPGSGRRFPKKSLGGTVAPVGTTSLVGTKSMAGEPAVSV